MLEFIIIVEDKADARTATALAERVITETVDWLAPEILEHIFQWTGLEPNSSYSRWEDIRHIIKQAEESGLRLPRMLGHGGVGIKADGAAAKKILDFVEIIRHRHKREIGAVLFIRDLDNQPERRKGMEQARDIHFAQRTGFRIVIGTADRNREAWVLNGFIQSNSTEHQRLEDIRGELGFCPCTEAHRLRSASWNEPDRNRNPKVVLKKLTDGEYSREEQCWKETPLATLRTRGMDTGLTAYLGEIETRLVPLLQGGGSQ